MSRSHQRVPRQLGPAKVGNGSRPRLLENDFLQVLDPDDLADVAALDQQLELLEETACNNVGLVIDFYHLWGSGTRPDEIARLNKDVICCVDFCDSLDEFGKGDDFRQRGRDVWTGGGRIPLKDWVDAVRATGFDGIWRCELLSPTYWELDPWQTARDLRRFLEYLMGLACVT